MILYYKFYLIQLPACIELTSEEAAPESWNQSAGQKLVDISKLVVVDI